MATVLGSAEGLMRARARGALLAALEKELLLVKVRVFPDGSLMPELMDWDTYWDPLHALGWPEVTDQLALLHSAWRIHITSHFDPDFRKELCYRYFAFIDALMSSTVPEGSPHWKQALQKALGFECFQITSLSPEATALGAGTSTLRNPCYLLAKLKTPNALDDPRFLPVITVPNLPNPELFYHYRQYSLSLDSPTSLLLYPAVAETKRSASFKLLDSLISVVSDSIDPMTYKRAPRLSRGVVWPLIQAGELDGHGPLSLELVDVGAGSGSLAAAICRQIRGIASKAGLHLSLRLWSADLALSDPTRFFRDGQIRGLVDSLMFVGDDYRSWLANPQAVPQARGLRIAVVSKLLNNLSRFAIRYVGLEEVARIPAVRALLTQMDKHSPTQLLAPGGKGVEGLEMSNSRLLLDDGRAFVLPSLSQFYRGLAWLLLPQTERLAKEHGVFLPVRKLNPDCLVASDGSSVLARLLQSCRYIVIEDADLTPTSLSDHIAAFSLKTLSVQDISKALGLRGNYAYVIWATNEQIPSLPGERLW